MKRLLYFPLFFFIACAHDSDTEGVVYSGKANLNVKLHEFTAGNAEAEKALVITMTGPHELTFSLNNKVSHIDYEEDVIIIKSEKYDQQWTVRKIKNGFELEDGTLISYGNCRDWEMCLMDGITDLPLLKGKYFLSGTQANITLWISESEKHVELLALMANGLFNKSRNTKQSIDESLRTLSPQVWTY